MLNKKVSTDIQIFDIFYVTEIIRVNIFLNKMNGYIGLVLSLILILTIKYNG